MSDCHSRTFMAMPWVTRRKIFLVKEVRARRTWIVSMILVRALFLWLDGFRVMIEQVYSNKSTPIV